MTLWKRINSKYEVLPNGCWQWLGSITRAYNNNNLPYPQINIGGKTKLVHNVIFEIMHGSIDRTKERDHTCQNTLCINPFHVEQVSKIVNRQRQKHWNKDKTHCVHGHAFTGENTYYAPSSKQRHCKACMDKRRSSACHTS